MIPEVEEKPPKEKEKSSGKAGLLKLLRGWIRAAIFDNAAIKFVSLVLAVTLFILVNTGQDVTIWIDVGLSYTTPDDQVLVSDPVEEVTIGLRGSWRRTRRFDRRELDERITIDLRDQQDGLFEFQPHLFRIPQGLELVSITPRTMRLDFEPLASRSVPIQVETVGSPAAGYRVANATARPRSVTVRGAKSRVEEIDAVETLGVSLDGRKESFVDTYPLKLPGGVAVEGTTNVEVKVELVEELERRVLQGVPVVVRSTDPGVPVDKRFEVEPAQVEVVLLGSQQDIEAAIDGPLFPYVTVAPGFGGGKVPVLLGVSGVAHEIKPQEVTVTRVKPALPD